MPVRLVIVQLGESRRRVKCARAAEGKSVAPPQDIFGTHGNRK